MTIELLRGVTALTTGDTFQIPVPSGPTAAVAQIEITGSATVVVEGRTSPVAPWITLTTQTSSAIASISSLSEMRARVSVYSSGSVSCWVFAPRLAR